MFIGVTGGVGAGKSTILQILEEEYNAYIILADDVARELMKKGKASYRAVVKAFGKDILREDREIDRQILADIVFNDEEKLNLLNSIVHPLVRKAIVKEQKQVNKKDPHRLVVLEAALLIEAGYKELLDELWAVIVQKEIRIQRLMNDRGYTREKSESIIANQLSDEEFRANCDFVIDNSGTLEESAEQIRKHFERNKDR